MRVLVATVGKPFGLRGQVTLRILTDEPESRLSPGQVLYPSEGARSGLRVISLRVEAPGGVLGLETVTDRNRAESLRGTELWAEVDGSLRPGERDRAPTADPDEWYDYQLIGLPCFSTAGTHLGDVVDVLHLPAQDCLLVRGQAGDVMVPFVRAIVPAVSRDRITIADPGGLFPTGEDGSTEPSSPSGGA